MTNTPKAPPVLTNSKEPVLLTAELARQYMECSVKDWVIPSAEFDLCLAALASGQTLCVSRAEWEARQEPVAYLYGTSLTLAEDADDFLRGEGTPLYAAPDKEAIGLSRTWPKEHVIVTGNCLTAPDKENEA